MARISPELISSELEEFGWKLISTEYKNLDSELIFECEEGHLVYSNWKKIRDRQECPTCANNYYKEQKTNIISKNKNTTRILALDQSTTITGFAILDNGKLIRSGIFKTRNKNTFERIGEVCVWVLNLVNNWSPDIVVIEDIQLQQHGAKNSDNVIGIQTFKTLAHLQGAILYSLFTVGLIAETCYPATWRAHCGVKGRTKVDKKNSMKFLIKEWYDVSVSDDEADAIGIGKYAAENRFVREKNENWE